MTAVIELDDPGAERFYREFCRTNTPCVARGGASDWPAITRWRDDGYLRQLAGSRPIARTRSVRQRNEYDHASPIAPVLFREFLDGYREHPRWYINDAAMPGILVQDIASHPMLDGFARLDDFKRRIGMFFGAGSQRAPLHYDDEDNIYIVIHGRKRFKLYDVSDFSRMYPHDDAFLPDFSRVDDDDVDDETFPRFRDATCYEITLDPGDILYVPGYWWHSVMSHGRSIALSWVRLDRYSQILVLRKLLDDELLPIAPRTRRALQAMLESPSRTASTTLQQARDGQLQQQDIWHLLVRILCFACVLGDHVGDRRGLIDRATADDPLSRRFDEFLGQPSLSHPIRYLVANFVRCDSSMFHTQSTAIH